MSKGIIEKSKRNSDYNGEKRSSCEMSARGKKVGRSTKEAAQGEPASCIFSAVCFFVLSDPDERLLSAFHCL